MREVLVLKKTIFLNGIVLFFRGLEVYAIDDSKITAEYINEFTHVTLEPFQSSSALTSKPSVLLLYIEKIECILAIKKGLERSRGKTNLLINVPGISHLLLDELLLHYPASEKTSIRKLTFNSKLFARKGTEMFKIDTKSHGVEILSFENLSILTKIFGPEITWAPDISVSSTSLASICITDRDCAFLVPADIPIKTALQFRYNFGDHTLSFGIRVDHQKMPKSFDSKELIFPTFSGGQYLRTNEELIGTYFIHYGIVYMIISVRFHFFYVD